MQWAGVTKTMFIKTEIQDKIWLKFGIWGKKITQIIIHVILFLSQNKYECRYELGNWTKLTWNTKLYNNNQKISNMLQLPYTFNLICSSFISETVKITHDTHIFYEHNISNFKKCETFIQVNWNVWVALYWTSCITLVVATLIFHCGGCCFSQIHH